MRNKPAIADRSIRQALGPYARIELYTPPSRARVAVRCIVKGSAYLVASVTCGAAFGYFLTFVERL